MIKRKPTLKERAQGKEPVVKSTLNRILDQTREELEAEFRLFAHAHEHESTFHARTILSLLEGARLH